MLISLRSTRTSQTARWKYHRKFVLDDNHDIDSLFAPHPLSEIFEILGLYSNPVFHNIHTPNPHNTAPTFETVSSSGSADHDALQSAKNIFV
jgi:hypothetical protein